MIVGKQDAAKPVFLLTSPARLPRVGGVWSLQQVGWVARTVQASPQRKPLRKGDLPLITSMIASRFPCCHCVH